MPAIFGDTWLDDARAGLVTLIQSLIDETDGYDPRIAHVYDQHFTANLPLNSATVGLESVESEYIAHNNADQVKWSMVFSIRVHTDYLPGAMKEHDNARLITSVVNKLKENRVFDKTPDHQIYIEEITGMKSNVNFDDTGTLGAECLAQVRSIIAYDQE
jgi:hypothetical protein